MRSCAMLAVVVLLSACGGGEEPPPRAADEGATSTAAPPEPPDAPTSTRGPETNVYFVRDEQVGTVHRPLVPPEVGRGALEALLEGPTEAERRAGLTSAIPAGTELLGLEIADGVATVDLAREFESGGGSLSTTLRVAQVVYTLTQFPTVEQVEFRLDGEQVEAIGGEGVVVAGGVGREDFEDVTPPILLESPAPGDAISDPVRITGTANTFEATFMVRVLDSADLVLAEDFVTATSGSGTRGTFDATIAFDRPVEAPAEGTLVVYEASAEDGSAIHVISIPVELEP